MVKCGQRMRMSSRILFYYNTAVGNSKGRGKFEIDTTSCALQ